MSQEVLRSGDQANYNQAFGPAIVTASPGILTGSAAPVRTEGTPVCVQGDEASATVPGCAYISGGFTIPGVGTLSITVLGADQLSKKNRSKGKPLMLRGSAFTAQFQVTAPAQMPTASGPVPDPMPIYTGTGTFRPGGMKVRDKGS